MDPRQWIKRVAAPLASRKVRAAIATVVAAWAVQWFPDVDESLVYTVLSVGVAIILGIAIEDNGIKGSS